MAIGFHEIRIEESDIGTVVNLIIKEKLRKKDYEDFVPKIESQMQDGSKIRLIVELRDFEGWTIGALWENTKFATKHFNDIDRLAVAGDMRWAKRVTMFLKPFTAAEVKYYDIKDIDKAKKWIYKD